MLRNCAKCCETAQIVAKLRKVIMQYDICTKDICIRVFECLHIFFIFMCMCIIAYDNDSKFYFIFHAVNGPKNSRKGK
jgi:hypothetical protein